MEGEAAIEIVLVAVACGGSSGSVAVCRGRAVVHDCTPFVWRVFPCQRRLTLTTAFCSSPTYSLLGCAVLAATPPHLSYFAHTLSIAAASLSQSTIRQPLSPSLTHPLTSVHHVSRRRIRLIETCPAVISAAVWSSCASLIRNEWFVVSLVSHSQCSPPRPAVRKASRCCLLCRPTAAIQCQYGQY